MAGAKVEPGEAEHDEHDRPTDTVHHVVDKSDNGIHISLIGSK